MSTDRQSPGSGGEVPLAAAQSARLAAFAVARTVDLHCHCLPGLDDGPPTPADAVELCRALVADGTTTVIATPHQLGSYDGVNAPADVRRAVADLRVALAAGRVPLEVLPGADVRVDDRLLSLLAAGEVLTLADANRYVLLELPHETYIDLRHLIGDLAAAGLTSVVSHPERHAHLARHPDLVRPWIAVGGVLQVTAGSLLGAFGTAAADAGWRLLTMGAVALVATDAHDVHRRPPVMTAATAAIAKRFGHAVARRVCVENPLRVPPRRADPVRRGATADGEGRMTPNDTLDRTVGRPPRRHRDRLPHRPTSDWLDAAPRGPADRFDDAVEWTFGGLLAFAPLAFGSWPDWAQEVVVVLVAAMALTVVAKRFRAPTGPVTFTWAYVPIALFLALAVFQAVPLPAALVRAVSPGTLALRTELVAGVPGAAAAVARPTISLYPHSTLAQLRLVLAVATVFVVVLDVYRTPARIRRLLATVALVGLAVAVLAAYQNLTHADTVYGVVPAEHRNSGPFMNYSHFSQSVNLAVGAAAGLLLATVVGVAGREGAADAVLRELGRPRQWLVWPLALTCVLGPVTVLLSMSRMGAISMLVAAGVVGAALAVRGRGTGAASLPVAVGVAVLAVLLSVGFDAVYARLATVRNFTAGDTAGSRLEILRDVGHEFRRFPVLGAGLGTHQTVFPMFDTRFVPSVATHAENEYAQTLGECGAVGVALVVAFVLPVAAALVRTLWRPREPTQYAALGLAFGLLAVLIHSGSDFGQHAPANAIVTATFAALAITLWRRPWQPATVAEPVTPAGGRRLTRVVAAVAVLAAFGWAVAGADVARRAEASWAVAQARVVDLEKADWRGTPDDFIGLLAPAAAAADLEPGDVAYRYWLNVYRWRAISQNLDPATGVVSLPPTAARFAARIVDELEGCRLLCPTYGPPLCVAGQLKISPLGRVAEGTAEVRTAYGLTPTDPMVSLTAGVLDVREGRWADSVGPFRRCVRLGGSADEVIDAYVWGKRYDLAYAFAAGDRGHLLHLADRVPAGDPAGAAVVAQCRTEAAALLAVAAARPDAPPDVLAELADVYGRRGRTADAIDAYRRAIDGDFSRVDWHLNLGRLLMSAGRYADAAREFRVYLQFRPKTSAVQAALDECLTREDGAASRP